jgi:hypothetical protein
MTTAHRPTWAPARGGEEQGGMRLFVASRARSAKDQPAQLSMKFRGKGQAGSEDLDGKDLKVRAAPGGGGVRQWHNGAAARRRRRRGGPTRRLRGGGAARGWPDAP